MFEAIIDPTAGPAADSERDPAALAARPASLSGLRLGLLANTKRNAEEVGDCGSCSASAVADGLLLEQGGIPAVVICSDAFTVSADAMADLRGAPGYQYVTTAHPVANLTPDGVRARAAQAVPAIVALLTQPATEAAVAAPA